MPNDSCEIGDLEKDLKYSPDEARKKFVISQRLLLESCNSSLRPKSLKLTEEQITINVLEGGKGEPLIFLPSNFALALEWISLTSIFENQYHIIIPELPGNGLSDPINYKKKNFKAFSVDFINSLLEHYNYPNATLIGNYLGGYMILQFALKYPEKVKKLIFIGALAGIDRDIPKFLSLCSVRIINDIICKALIRPTISSQRELFKDMLVVNLGGVSLNLLKCYQLSMLFPRTLKSKLSLFEEFFSISGIKKKYLVVKELESIKQPVLFLWGDKDWFLPYKIGLEKTEKISNRDFKIINNAGNLPWFDQIEEIQLYLSEFLRK